MIRNSLEALGEKYNHYYVISSCSYAYEGLVGILSQESKLPQRISSDSENLTPDEFDLFTGSRGGCILVYLRGDIDTILSSLKKAAIIINTAQCEMAVYIISRFPPQWISFVFRPMVNDQSHLSMVYCSDVNLSCARTITDKFISVSSVIVDSVKFKGRKIKQLSAKELAVMINHYRGLTVKQLPQHYGISEKSAYVYRKKGVEKLNALQQWLNNEYAKNSCA